MMTKAVMDKITLTAFRNGPLLILYWSQTEPLPTHFRIVLNSSVDIAKPYLAIPLGAARNRMLFIALADITALSNKVSLAIVDSADNTKLASVRKSLLPVLCEQHLQFLTLTERLLTAKVLDKGLRATFPTLEVQVIDDLLRIVALDDVASFAISDWIYLRVAGTDIEPLRFIEGSARVLEGGDRCSIKNQQQPFLVGAGQLHTLIPAAWIEGEAVAVLLTVGRQVIPVTVRRESMTAFSAETLPELLAGAAESAGLLSDFLAARILPARIEWLQNWSETIAIGWLTGRTAPADLEPFTLQLRQVNRGLTGRLWRILRVEGRVPGSLVFFEWSAPPLELEAIQIEYLRDGHWWFAQTPPTEGGLVQRLAALGASAELALQFWELGRDFGIPLPVNLAVWLEPARQHCLAKLARVWRQQSADQQTRFDLVLEHGGWLPDAGLLLSGYLVAPPGSIQRLMLHLPARSIDLSNHWVRVSRPDLERNYQWAGYTVDERPGFEVFLLLEETLTTLEAGYLVVEFDDDRVARVALRPVIHLTASRDVLDLPQALRLLEGFGPLLPAQARHSLRPVLAVISDWLGQTQAGLLIKGRTAAEGIQLRFDYVLALSRQSLYLCGWLVDIRHHIAEIRLFTALGDTVDLTGQIPNAARPDVRQTLQKQGLTLANEFVGFHLRVELPVSVQSLKPSPPTPLPPAGEGSERLQLPLARGAETPVYLRIRLRDGAIHRLALSLRRYDAEQPLPLIRELLGSFPTWEPRLFEFYNRAVGPVISQLWQGRALPPLDIQQETFGIIPPAPQVSIIVPLYGRIDLLSFQLAQFANDPAFQQCELIYVLDDPALYSAFVSLCRREYPLFRVPFRTIISGANLGYAGATNLGAAQAQGDYLLLLNSDVFPKEPGWLMRMVKVFEGLDRPGVLGPKLLLADGLIQHAGMTFFQEPSLPGFWFNDHPEKGLPNDSTADAESRQVAAVTGACMLLRREVYREVGGLSEDYILGDFEDSDLCLKLRTAGYRIWYTPQIALYHLERLSFPHAGDAGWRTNLSRYNAWVQTKRWGEVIRGLCDNAATQPG